MVRHHRAMSGTIPSMETLHDDLKDNTIIVGRDHPLVSLTPVLHILLSLVLGASGDLAKKKVSSLLFRLVTGLKCLLDNTCTFWPLSLGSPSS
jgi:glucose-6-phosphate 1-dehydrogenase